MVEGEGGLDLCGGGCRLERAIVVWRGLGRWGGGVGRGVCVVMSLGKHWIRVVVLEWKGGSG